MTDRAHIEGDSDQILKLQHELSRILANVVDPMVGLQEALDRVVCLPGVDGVWTWFRSDDGDDFNLGHTAGLSDVLSPALDAFPADSPVARRLSAGQESVGNWEEIWPAKAAVIRELGWDRVAVLPIMSQGEVVGALGGGRQSSECLSGGCLWVLRTLANAIGSLLASVRFETQHRTTSENLARLLNSFSDRLYIIDTTGKVLFHNLAAVNGGRAGQRDIIGREFEDILPGYGRLLAAVRGLDSLVADDVHALPLEAQLVDGAGRSHPVEVRIESGVWDSEPAEIVVCRDIRGRLDLAHRNERLVTAINHVADGILITDKQGTIEYVNPSFCRLSGYSRAEAMGQNPRLVKSEQHGESFYREMWETLLRGEVWSGRIVNRNRTGELYTVEATLSPVIDNAGGITHFVGVTRDVTREIQMEDRLRERQKMEAVGTLAGGIAHDFNNILYALLGYVDLALDDIPGDHPAHPALCEVVSAGQRASSLVAKMLTFGRRSDGTRELEDLGEILNTGLELVRASLPASVRIETELDLAGCRVMADVPQLHQMLLNICQNAYQALPDEVGEIRVVAGEANLDVKQAGELASLQPGRWAVIKISDTGCGITPEVLGRIFEPYFTTRSSQAGHGLGLATVHGIVASHQGRVVAESRVGVGSTFTVFLPVQGVAAEKNVPGAGGRNQAPVAGHGRIMVIDDEAMVTDVLKKALTRFGFEAEVFENGVQALELFRSDPYRFDVVITDQSMPNITGFELAGQMLALRPDLPLILTTGYSEKINQEAALAAGISCFLPKPLRLRELGEILTTMVSAKTVTS